MKSKIENTDDLRAEILRLKLQRFHHEAAIKEDFNKFKDKFRLPTIMLNKVKSLFGSDSHTHGADKNNHDWVTNALRIGLPMAINRLFFGKSGFIVKSVVALVSQKAATSVNKDTLTNLIDKASHWIRGKAKSRKEKSRLSHDYGIPPDSETY